MISILSLIIQKYWTVYLPLLHKYWRISIPIIFCLILLAYILTVPFGSEQFWLGIASILSFSAYGIIEFFFGKEQSIELVNAYSETPADFKEGEKRVPSLIKNTLEFSIPKKIEQNKEVKISITIDSIRAVVKLAKSSKHIKNIRTDDFKLRISSKDLIVSPEEAVNLSELGEQFPINFDWSIKGETLGKKEIMIHPSKEFSNYLGLSAKQSSAWIEAVEVVDNLGWSSRQLSVLKYGLLGLGIIFSIPLMHPAFNLLIDEVTDSPLEEPIEVVEELEAYVKEEFAVLEEIKKDERIYLEEEDIQWHFKLLEEYQGIIKNIAYQKKSNPHYKLFWLKHQNYKHDIYQKLRRSYAKILSNQDTSIVYEVNEDERQLICISNNFKDSLFTENFLLNKKDVFIKYDFLKLCLGSKNIEAHLNCEKEIILQSK